MVYRNSESDAGRNGARSRTKADAGYQYVMPNAKGRFLPAYGGGMGRSAAQYDDCIGTAEDEVGNDDDAGRYPEGM